MPFSFERGIVEAEGRTLKMTGVCLAQRKKQAGHLLYCLEDMVTRTLLETIFRMNGQQSNMPQHFQSKNMTIFD